MPNQLQPQPGSACPVCGSVLELKQGVSKKTGQAYKFTGCSNFPNCTFTTPPPSAPAAASQPGVPASTPVGQDNIIRGLGVIREDIQKLEENLKVFIRNVIAGPPASPEVLDSEIPVIEGEVQAAKEELKQKMTW